MFISEEANLIWISLVISKFYYATNNNISTKEQHSDYYAKIIYEKLIIIDTALWHVLIWKVFAQATSFVKTSYYVTCF